MVVPALLVVAAYVAVLVLYGSSTRLDVAGERLDAQPDDGVLVAVELVSVDPLTGTAQAMVRALPAPRLLDRELRLKERLQVQIVSSFPTERPDQTRMGFEVAKLEFPRGSSFLSLAGTAALAVDGQPQNYPFDTFRTTLISQASGPSGDYDATELAVLGDVPAWLIRGQEVAEVPIPAALDVTLVRAGSTKTFVILLLVAMVVLAVLGLLVAGAVSTGRRKVEATMASWFAAMLFALIPLRLNLPGAPPIGVWMDFIVVLWVLLAIMAGLALFIVSWLRRTPAPETPRAAPTQDLASDS